MATLVRQSKTTQNVFWSYVKRLKQENPRIADFEVDGKVISDGGLPLPKPHICYIPYQNHIYVTYSAYIYM